MSDYLDAAVEIAREAGSLVAELSSQPLDIGYKHRADLVTVADRRSEALIVSFLRQRFPDHAIVGEEGGGQQSSSGYCWYVDPLDGTTNFAHGVPVYCVTMGLAYQGEVIAGVVYDPSRNHMYAAERGSGAFLNGTRLKVSQNDKLGQSLVGTGFPPFVSDHALNIKLFFQFTQLTHGVRRLGSAALDLCYVAAGHFDAFWELKLNPWDKAAGTLLVTEAGGKVSDVWGAPFSVLGDDVFVSNGLIHDAMLKAFAEILPPATKG